MRLRENEIDLVVRHIMDRLEHEGCLSLDAGSASLFERLKKAIIDDLMVEDNLNREVEDILKKHSNDMRGGTIDYRRMFAMIKSKLAKDRNLILS
jgi:hypothetical protein